MRTLIVALACALIATSARASDSDSPGTTSMFVRPLVGAFIPTGAQRKELSSSILTGAQLGYDLPVPIRLVGSVAWTPSHDRDFSDVRTSILQYDGGVELASHRSSDDQWKLGPFVGAGLGARTYKLNRFTSSDHTDFDGYGSVGGELSRSRLGARLEVRDYVSRFKDVAVQPQSTSTRNDLMVTGAITLHL